MITDRKHLDNLNQLIAKSNRTIPVWLEELLLLGPRFELWKRAEMPANRVLLTEMLAQWLKFAGVSQDECQEWLLAYCCEVLAEYFKSGPSAIRHGTKANTRWVYKSGFNFDFDAIIRDLPPPAAEGEPAWMALFAKFWQLLGEAKQKARDSYVPPVFVPVLPVKQRFREQYEKAVAFALERKGEGKHLTDIVQLLNEQGFLTCTGRKWTEGILYNTLRKLPTKEVGEP